MYQEECHRADVQWYLGKKIVGGGEATAADFQPFSNLYFEENHPAEPSTQNDTEQGELRMACVP